MTVRLSTHPFLWYRELTSGDGVADFTTTSQIPRTVHRSLRHPRIRRLIDPWKRDIYSTAEFSTYLELCSSSVDSQHHFPRHICSDSLPVVEFANPCDITMSAVQRPSGRKTSDIVKALLSNGEYKVWHTLWFTAANSSCRYSTAPAQIQHTTCSLSSPFSPPSPSPSLRPPPPPPLSLATPALLVQSSAVTPPLQYVHCIGHFI